MDWQSLTSTVIYQCTVCGRYPLLQPPRPPPSHLVYSEVHQFSHHSRCTRQNLKFFPTPQSPFIVTHQQLHPFLHPQDLIIPGRHALPPHTTHSPNALRQISREASALLESYSAHFAKHVSSNHTHQAPTTSHDVGGRWCRAQ